MFPTLNEVKALLGIEGDAHDDRLALQLPIVRDRLTQICNNDFRMQFAAYPVVPPQYIQFGGRDVSLCSNFIYAKTARTVATSQFDLREYYQVGNDVIIEGTMLNNGYRIIEAVAEHLVTLADDGTEVWDEDTVLSALTVAMFPDSIKDAVAEMAAWDVFSSRKTAGISSESLGGYSVSYKGDIGQFGYPRELIAKLDGFRRLRVY